MTDTNAIAAFSGTEAFESAQRMARALSESTLVPEQYRGPKSIPNVLIAINMASRIGADPLMVMQNLHVIHGRPGFSASFLIACVNRAEGWGRIRYETRGDDPSDDGYACRVVVRDQETGEDCAGEWVSWAMVRAEGWDKKAGSKWRTLPGQMFRYRAAAFWQRAYAPELSLGMHSAEEVADIHAAEHYRPQAPPALASLEAALLGPQADADPVIDADTGEVLDADTATMGALL